MRKRYNHRRWKLIVKGFHIRNYMDVNNFVRSNNFKLNFNRSRPNQWMSIRHLSAPFGCPCLRL